MGVMSELFLEREACVNRSFKLVIKPKKLSGVFSDIVTSSGYATSVAKLAEPCVKLTLGSARSWKLFSFI